MRNRLSLFLVCLLLCLLCTAGCFGAQALPAVEPTDAPTSVPTPEPTPIRVGGHTAEDGVLRAVVDADDFDVIEQIPHLRVLDVSGSVCYDAILSYRDAHPDVAVRYTVTIGETEIECDASAASVRTVSDASLFAYLPDLLALTVEEPLSPAQVAELFRVLPDAALTYSVTFAGLTVPNDAAMLDLSETSPALVSELADGIDVLPNLVDIELNRADGSSDWTLEQAGVLQAVRPELRVDLNVHAFDTDFSLTDEVVSFSDRNLSERLDEVKALLPYLRSVKRLDMENCRIPDEEMAALREQYPSPKIVWRIHVGVYSCRTDAVMIRFSDFFHKPILKDKDVHPLIYCNDVKYLDLGHNEIQNPYFVAYMPNLEVCILAIHQPTDISAFANCPHLEYAELFNGHITDVSPLSNCKELKHLNISKNKISDITPLYGLTQLERLWIAMNPIPQEQVDEIRRLMPDCFVNMEAWEPTQNEWRYDKSRPSGNAERYDLLRKQFMYDTGVITYSDDRDFD